MSTSPMGANKPIEDIEAHLQGKTKSALDELVWWARATMAAKAAEASPRRDPKELAICGHRVRGVDGGSAVDRLSHAARSLNARL